MIDIFRGKKDEIKNKLHDDDPNQEQIRLTSTKKPKARKNDDNGWISLIKTELTERSVSPNRQTNKTVAKAPLRSPFLQDGSDDKKIKFQFIHNQKKKIDPRDSSPIQDQRRSSPSPASGRCVRCSLPVATVDRILISGVLLHRACLTCSRCSVTLRLSEVRDGAGDDVCNFNYLCILCSKNRANNNHATRHSDRMSTSVDGSLLVTRPPPAPVSPNQQRKQGPMTAPPVEKVAPSFGPTDEYELRLRERMKWKEQFLLNNNNIDFGPLVKRQVFKTSSVGTSDASQVTHQNKSCTHKEKEVVDQAESITAGTQTSVDTTDGIASPVTDSPAVTPASPTNSHKINERIEYENVSQSFELYDDDELTKLLNLESTDQWESGEESSSSGSWRRSDDSTDADFDSDEFDVSNASKHAERRRLEAQKRRQTTGDQEALVVPEIVVQTTEEEATATSQEIDTQILDTAGGGSSLRQNDSTLDQVSVTDSLNAEHVSPDLLMASASLMPHESCSQNICSNSDSDSGESRTLADELPVSRKRLLYPSSSSPPTRSSDLSSKEGQEDEDETLDTSVSSLSCCDVSGTFEDLNLLSLVDEERTAGGSERTAASVHTGLSITGSTASPLLTSNTLTSVASTTSDVTASPSPPDSASVRLTPTTTSDVCTNNRHSLSNHSNAGSPARSPASSSTLVPSFASSAPRLLTGSTFSDRVSPKLTDCLRESNTSSSISHCASSSNTSSNGTKASTSFKVAQPKFTVFNFDFKLPPTSTAGSAGSNSTTSSLALRSVPSLTHGSHFDPSIKSFCSYVSRNGTSGGLSEGPSTSERSEAREGPPTYQNHETYSRIPVLSTRVNESNGSSGKGKTPSYSGSFTEKLMMRCRSSPTLHGKENLESEAGAPAAPAYESVLAKWACNNLFQMERASSPASTYSVMDLLSRRSNDTGNN